MKSGEQISEKIPMNNLSIIRICLLIAVIAITLASCDKEEFVIDPDNPLVGNWTYSHYDSGALFFERSNGFINDHCYKFNPDGSMTERKNSGSCGTPPISYADFTGTWSFKNDSLIEISVGYWGGTVNYILDFQFRGQNLLEATYIQQD
jgi:hypothetical protein